MNEATRLYSAYVQRHFDGGNGLRSGESVADRQDVETWCVVGLLALWRDTLGRAELPSELDLDWGEIPGGGELTVTGVLAGAGEGVMRSARPSFERFGITLDPGEDEGSGNTEYGTVRVRCRRQPHRGGGALSEAGVYLSVTTSVQLSAAQRMAWRWGGWDVRCPDPDRSDDVRLARFHAGGCLQAEFGEQGVPLLGLNEHAGQWEQFYVFDWRLAGIHPEIGWGVKLRGSVAVEKATGETMVIDPDRPTGEQLSEGRDYHVVTPEEREEAEIRRELAVLRYQESVAVASLARHWRHDFGSEPPQEATLRWESGWRDQDRIVVSSYLPWAGEVPDIDGDSRLAALAHGTHQRISDRDGFLDVFLDSLGMPGDDHAPALLRMVLSRNVGRIERALRIQAIVAPECRIPLIDKVKRWSELLPESADPVLVSACTDPVRIDEAWHYHYQGQLVRAPSDGVPELVPPEEPFQVSLARAFIAECLATAGMVRNWHRLSGGLPLPATAQRTWERVDDKLYLMRVVLSASQDCRAGPDSSDDPRWSLSYRRRSGAACVQHSGKTLRVSVAAATVQVAVEVGELLLQRTTEVQLPDPAAPVAPTLTHGRALASDYITQRLQHARLDPDVGHIIDLGSAFLFPFWYELGSTGLRPSVEANPIVVDKHSGDVWSLVWAWPFSEQFHPRLEENRHNVSYDDPLRRYWAYVCRYTDYEPDERDRAFDPEIWIADLETLIIGRLATLWSPLTGRLAPPPTVSLQCGDDEICVTASQSGGVDVLAIGHAAMRAHHISVDEDLWRTSGGHHLSGYDEYGTIECKLEGSRILLIFKVNGDGAGHAYGARIVAGLERRLLFPNLYGPRDRYSARLLATSRLPIDEGAGVCLPTQAVDRGTEFAFSWTFQPPGGGPGDIPRYMIIVDKETGESRTESAEVSDR